MDAIFSIGPDGPRLQSRAQASLLGMSCARLNLEIEQFLRQRPQPDVSMRHESVMCCKGRGPLGVTWQRPRSRRRTH